MPWESLRELTFGCKMLGTTFFVAEVQGNYNIILGHNGIHANHCVPSTFDQFLIQLARDEVEVFHADVSACVALANVSIIGAHENVMCLTVVDFFDYEFLSVSKDGFVIDANLEWLKHRVSHYRSGKNDMCEAINDLKTLQGESQPRDVNRKYMKKYYPSVWQEA